MYQLNALELYSAIITLKT